MDIINELKDIWIMIVALLPSLASVIAVLSSVIKLKAASKANKDETILKLKDIQTNSAQELDKLREALVLEKQESEQLQSQIKTIYTDNHNLRKQVSELTANVNKLVDKVNIEPRQPKNKGE